MRYKFSILLITLSHACFAQTDSIISKWAAATISIETRAHESGMYDKYFQNLPPEKMDWLRDSIHAVNDLRGTAIFLKYNGGHYLLTARHVVYDKTESDTSMIAALIILIPDLAALGSPTEKHRSPNLMNYASGPPEMWPYIFSSVFDDMALISLDADVSEEFTKTLYRRGYKPIELSDIDTTGMVAPDTKVFMIGFPSAFSPIARDPGEWVSKAWDSNIGSIPIITRGQVYRNEKSNNYLTGNIINLWGFSGGPLITEKGKLVAITKAFDLKVAQNKLSKEYVNLTNVFMKTSLLPGLMRRLQENLKRR